MAAPDSNARFQSIDSSLTDLAEKKSSKVNNKTAYHTANELATAVGSYDNTSSGLTATTIQAAIDENAAAVASGGYTYTEVAITSVEIKSCGSTPVTILPAAGANKYYDYYGSIEYTHITANYTFTGDLLFIGEDYSYDASTKIRPNFIKSSVNTVVEFSSKSFDVLGTVGVNDYPTANERLFNQGVVFGTLNGTDPTGASAAGTILVKIYYKLKTKGTEL